MNDSVQSPDHYTWLPGIEMNDVACHFPFNRGSAIKYIWRAGRKTADAREDLRKAIRVLELEIDMLDSDSTPRRPGLYEKGGLFGDLAEAEAKRRG